MRLGFQRLAEGSEQVCLLLRVRGHAERGAECLERVHRRNEVRMGDGSALVLLSLEVELKTMMDGSHGLRRTVFSKSFFLVLGIYGSANRGLGKTHAGGRGCATGRSVTAV